MGKLSIGLSVAALLSFVILTWHVAYHDGTSPIQILEKNYMTIIACLILLELLALGIAISSRKIRAGKLGILIASISLLIMFLFMGLFFQNMPANPVNYEDAKFIPGNSAPADVQ